MEDREDEGEETDDRKFEDSEGVYYDDEGRPHAVMLRHSKAGRRR